MCVLIGLDWAEPMMQFFLHVICSCISHAYVLLFNILDIFETAWDFSDYHSFSPFRSGASSSSDPSPSTVWLHDDDSFKAFLEKFSRRGIHLERQVVLSDFADTNLPSVIHSKGWESLCDIPVTCPLVLI